jgi:hypothetical protein
MPTPLREPTLVAPGWLPRRPCDLSRGDVQCSALLRLPNADFTMSCSFIADHAGAHRTHGLTGHAWFDPAFSFPELFGDLRIDFDGLVARYQRAAIGQTTVSTPPPTAWAPQSPHVSSLISPPPSVTNLQTTTSPPAEQADIRVGENGYIHGVDGMLDQVAGALMKHAGPMLVRDVLPLVQQDAPMQARVGQAMGDAVASKVLPWVIVGASALGVMAVVGALRWQREKERLQAPGSRLQARRRNT